MGANNAVVKSISEATGARINIPPLSLNKDEITIAGEKECVAKAVSQIWKLHSELVRSWTVYVCLCKQRPLTTLTPAPAVYVSHLGCF